jgi:hypothetical protein
MAAPAVTGIPLARGALAPSHLAAGFHFGIFSIRTDVDT